jgi:hypothetical protein
VQCQDISSLEVHGTCCKTIVYDYGNFEQGAPGSGKGWRVELEHGRYDRVALENRGVHNNDISALEVELDEMCVQTGGKGTWMAAPPPLVPTNPGDGWGLSSSSAGGGQFHDSDSDRRAGPTRDGHSTRRGRASYDDEDRRDDMYGGYGEGSNQGSDEVTADWFRNDRHHGHSRHKRKHHHSQDEEDKGGSSFLSVVAVFAIAALRW